jgi:hypothetical protein
MSLPISFHSAQKEVARFFKPEEFHSCPRTLQDISYSSDEKH